MTTPVAGWYPDPSGQAPLRWWDGAGWSGTVTWGPAPSVAAQPWRTAGWWARVRGYLLDASLLWLASFFLLQRWHTPFVNELVGIVRMSMMTGGGKLPGPALWWDYGLIQMWLVTAIPGALMRVVHDMAFLVWRGATIGHQRVGLRVVAQDHPDGVAPPGGGLVWHRALRRSLVLRLLAPTCLGWLLCVLWPLADARSRTLADLAAGTRVIAASEPGPGHQTWA
ncbi:MULTISPECIES: DUF2510 domain-containing protein [unclassified Luteococcus]|uniref:DUF2510 domain-containing protein n=1 Tax=unclassified Luteococcus TaxID=2639923 RepID=UPI00313B0910